MAGRKCSTESGTTSRYSGRYRYRTNSQRAGLSIPISVRPLRIGGLLVLAATQHRRRGCLEGWGSQRFCDQNSIAPQLFRGGLENLAVVPHFPVPTTCCKTLERNRNAQT